MATVENNIKKETETDEKLHTDDITNETETVLILSQATRTTSGDNMLHNRKREKQTDESENEIEIEWKKKSKRPKFATIFSGLIGLLLVTMGIVFGMHQSISDNQDQKQQGNGNDTVLIFPIVLNAICFVWLLYASSCCSKTMISRYEDHHIGSLFLLIGVVVFGFCSALHSGLRLAAGLLSLAHKTVCNGVEWYLAMHASDIIFKLYQMYFLLRYYKVCIQVRPWLARLGLMAIMAKNISTVWRTLVLETLDDMNEITPKPNNTAAAGADAHLTCSFFDHGSTIDFNSLTVETYGSKVFYPCTIEYSIIAACLVWFMWKNVEEKKCSSNDNDIEQRARPNDLVHCSGSYRGLIVGLIPVLVMVICIIVFCILEKNASRNEISNDSSTESIDKPTLDFFQFLPLNISSKNHYHHPHPTTTTSVTPSAEVNITQVICLEEDISAVAYRFVIVGCNIFGLILVLVAYYCLYSVPDLVYDSHLENSLDRGLLLISFFGVLAKVYFVLTAYTEIYINDFKHCHNWYLFVSTIAHVLFGTQSFIQTIFVWLNLCTKFSSTNKTVKNLLAASLLCNISLWIGNIFEAVYQTTNPLALIYYDVLSWTIIKHITSALVILYRFHSAACFFEIWRGILYRNNYNDYEEV